MQTRLGDSVSGRYRPAEKILLTKHVVAAGRFAKDAGSTPAASTTFYRGVWFVIEITGQHLGKPRIGADLPQQRLQSFLLGSVDGLGHSMTRIKEGCSLSQNGISP